MNLSPRSWQKEPFHEDEKTPVQVRGLSFSLSDAPSQSDDDDEFLHNKLTRDEISESYQ